MLPSVNRRWFTGGADGDTLIPLSWDERSSYFNWHERPSTANKKRYREIGSPCRILLVGLDSSNLLPLKIIEKDTELTMFIMNEINGPVNPSFSIIAFR